MTKSKKNCQSLNFFKDRDIFPCDFIFQKFKKLIFHSTNRRKIYVMNCFRNYIKKFKKKSNNNGEKVQDQELKPGDLVRVKSREEINDTLDNWNKFGELCFNQEMYKYCGTEQKVKKKVERFLDEKDWVFKKTENIVILEDVFCEGFMDFGKCDKSCFYFWRVEWLRKLNQSE